MTNLLKNTAPSLRKDDVYRVQNMQAAPIAWEETLMGAGYKMKFGADIDIAAAQAMMNIQCLFPQQLEGTFSILYFVKVDPVLISIANKYD
jgi:hypothetical protein